MYMVKGNHVMKNGFTLYELLIVVAIIVILIALLAPCLSAAHERSHWRRIEEAYRQQYITRLSDDPQQVQISKTLGVAHVSRHAIRFDYQWTIGKEQEIVNWAWQNHHQDFFR
jgi:prepilin-type N-terminal cleavage/methylation domain-containing protein